MEQNIRRSEKVVKRFRDDWVDEKGYLHTKIVKEIITGPIDNVQASNPIKRLIMRKAVVPQYMPQPQQQIPQQKPLLDFGAMMKMGKKLMDDMGIDPKELLSDVFGEKKDELSDGEDYKDLTNLETTEKEVDAKCVKTKKQLKPQKKTKLKKQKKKVQKKTK